MTTIEHTTGKTSVAGGILNSSEINRMHNRAIGELRGTMKEIVAETAEVAQNLISRTESNTYRLVPFTPRIGLLVCEPERPGKFWPQLSLFPGGPCAALRNFFDRGDVWANAEDKAVWKLGLAVAEQSHISGQACRQLSRAIAAALAVRAGLSAPNMQETI